jgi:outer membrane protein
MSGFLDGLRHGILPALLLALGLPIAQAGAESRYNDWELWTSAANATLAAKRGAAGPFRINTAVGTAVVPDFFGSDNDNVSTRALLLLDVNYAGTLFLSTQQGVGWNMWRNRTMRAGPRVTFDFGRQAADSPSLNGLPDIETGTEIGLFIESFMASWRFKGDIRKEIGGGHGGLLINGEAAWGARWSKNAALILGMRTTYMDDTYADSYFTVLAANAGAGRPPYAAAAGFRDIGGFAQVVYDFTQAFYVATELRGTMLQSQAADSPITETDTSFTGSVMAGVRF